MLLQGRFILSGAAGSGTIHDNASNIHPVELAGSHPSLRIALCGGAN
jgi:hypothetical protein